MDRLDPTSSDEQMAAPLLDGLRTRGFGNPQAIYVFGSVARGQARAESDIDFAILCSPAPDPVRLFDLAQDLSRHYRRDVDLIDLSSASTVLRAQILRDGRRVFCADRTAADTFEMYTLSDYARLQEERGVVLRAFADSHGA